MKEVVQIGISFLSANLNQITAEVEMFFASAVCSKLYTDDAAAPVVGLGG